MYDYRLRPKREPVVDLAGRTDAGVHSLGAVGIVDLQKSDEASSMSPEVWEKIHQIPSIKEKLFFDPKIITLKLNQHFQRCNLDIRVLKTTAVPGTFHPRTHVWTLTRHFLFSFSW